MTGETTDARKRHAENAQVEPVHLKHSVDGWPLCWPMEREGEFKGTSHIDAVTCRPCLDALEAGE